MDTPKIKSVIPLAGRRLLVLFANGIHKVYDCNGLLGIDRFRLLKDEAFFKAVRVDAGGYGISWDDETDLSEYELWVRGVEPDDTYLDASAQNIGNAGLVADKMKTIG